MYNNLYNTCIQLYTLYCNSPPNRLSLSRCPGRRTFIRGFYFGILPSMMYRPRRLRRRLQRDKSSSPPTMGRYTCITIIIFYYYYFRLSNGFLVELSLLHARALFGNRVGIGANAICLASFAHNSRIPIISIT